jgi:hypothetical protein
LSKLSVLIVEGRTSKILPSFWSNCPELIQKKREMENTQKNISSVEDNAPNINPKYRVSVTQLAVSGYSTMMLASSTKHKR